MPLYLAWREAQIREFSELASQNTILKNVIVTGLRWVGKTVFLEEMKGRILRDTKLRWAQNDMSETVSVSEENLAIRMITDLAVTVSDLMISVEAVPKIGFSVEQASAPKMRLSYNVLMHIYRTAPGLVTDKLKFLLEYVWEVMKSAERNSGIIFAYDEAQNLEDHSVDKQYPLSALLEVFQYLQKKGIPFLLVLTGLPTLFPKLVESRTYSERMFHVITLDHLNSRDSKEAIIRPLVDIDSQYKFTEVIQNWIVSMSWGYPYFLQFISKEAFDFYLTLGYEIDAASLEQILHKLDEDFFMGRWCNITDREKELMQLIASILESDNTEFTIQDITSTGGINMSSSHINQSLARLIKKWFVYKDRHGKYNFAVPLLWSFIKRNLQQEQEPTF